MGWLWGSSKDGDPNNSTSNDPLRDLDPSLRDFLEKESPVKYKPSTNPPPPPEPAQPTAPPSLQPPVDSPDPSQPRVPSESLYPDGRYAHLWSTYRPLSAVESASRSDQEKLLDVLQGYKQRKAEIGRAALENCALEQWAVNDCFRNGGWKSRMSMCRAENRGLERCFLMQSRFLKALGYLSAYDRPPEVDEQIQMHADTLYHRMLDQERAVDEAKAAGLPVPSFPPITSSLRPFPVASGDETTPRTSEVLEASGTHETPIAQQEDLSPKVKAQLKERLKGLTGEERAAEEKAIAMERAAGETLAKQIGEIYEEQGKAKRQRKDQGRETFLDKVNDFFG